MFHNHVRFSSTRANVRTFKWVPQVTPEYWVRSKELASSHFSCAQNFEVVSNFGKFVVP